MFTFCLANDDSGDTEIKFGAYEDVPDAFVKLFTICQENVNVPSKKFKAFRNSIITRAGKPLRKLMEHASDTGCVFKILAENSTYCNWMNVGFLNVMAIACDNEYLQSTIRNYTNVIYSKSLREVWGYIPHHSVTRKKYYRKVMTSFRNKNPDDVTVKELLESKPKLAKKIAMHIAEIKEGSMLVTWLIPADEVYQAYLSFLTVPPQSRTGDLVQFDTWMAYLPQNVLQEYEKEINCGWLYITNDYYY